MSNITAVPYFYDKQFRRYIQQFIRLFAGFQYVKGYTEQKMQMLEQILVLFNPSLNIHTTNNPLDWSSLSVVELINTQWTNRGIPSGVDDIIDISSLTFEMPILINPPARVNKSSMIHTIITNLHEVATGDADSIKVLNDINAITTSYTVVAVDNKVKLSVNANGDATAQILGKNGAVEAGLNWETIFKQYGAELRSGTSQIRFKQTDDPGDMTTDIIGRLTGDSSIDTLTVTLDTNTIPADTQTAVDAVINPQNSYPGDGTLTAAANGDRYLVLDEVPSGGEWGTISAKKNDIIQYNGTIWSVDFDASSNATLNYTTNTVTMDKLKWNGSQWINAYEGTYNSGFWRIYL